MENRNNHGNHRKVVQYGTFVRCSQSLCSTTDWIINEQYNLQRESCEKNMFLANAFFFFSDTQKRDF